MSSCFKAPTNEDTTIPNYISNLCINILLSIALLNTLILLPLVNADVKQFL